MDMDGTGRGRAGFLCTPEYICIVLIPPAQPRATGPWESFTIKFPSETWSVCFSGGWSPWGDSYFSTSIQGKISSSLPHISIFIALVIGEKSGSLSSPLKEIGLWFDCTVLMPRVGGQVIVSQTHSILYPGNVRENRPGQQACLCSYGAQTSP